MDFADFWNIYPRRIAKKAAEKAWAKLTKTQQTAALDALPNHIRLWILRDKEYVPHPASWLNGERWTDELEEPRANGQWWATHEGIDRKGKEVGLAPSGTESYEQYKARIFDAIIK